jgi:fatty acid/phospholipid biosynthesis enzyme
VLPAAVFSRPPALPWSSTVVTGGPGDTCVARGHRGSLRVASENCLRSQAAAKRPALSGLRSPR